MASAEAIDVASVAIEPDALRKIPRSLAFQHDVLSLSSDGNELTVLVPESTQRETFETIRFATGMHVHALRAPRDAIRARLNDVYREAPLRAPSPPEAPAVALVNEIHRDAICAGASDVHIEPWARGGRVRQRVGGILRPSRAIGDDLYIHVVSRIKLLAGMDIADKRQPQDGRYDIETSGQSLDARVSSVPTIAGEKLAIRLLDHHARIPRLDQLDFPEECYERLKRVCSAPHGFIVAAGPTGSGKTTTLYGVMSQRDTTSENLCSVEDPIEVRIPGISQVQVNVRAGVTFASALRAFLRQDPNVIMVGEMRDQETAAVAASASLSGQLVLTTLHSNDAPSAVERLVELGVHRRTMSAGLTAIVAQRLVRRLCAQCRSPYQISKRDADEFRIAEGATIHRAGACAECANTGYTQRSALFEVLFVDDAIREAISSGVSSVSLGRIAQGSGFTPMLQHGIRRLLNAETSIEELRRVLAIGLH
ncbi:MAG TPA: GspE/PulE family protein [Candidatus Rubrimentiphilum sp.]|nr:GspE/PulE family protein [Candidatus Rubrimentiphilum sp.]